MLEIISSFGYWWQSSLVNSLCSFEHIDNNIRTGACMSVQLTGRAEKEAEKAENLRPFSGMKLLHIKNKVAEILSLIGRNEIFDEYTRHDISHIDEMLALVDWIIPSETSVRLTPSDWLMITLSVYFHDLGMLVTKEEYDKRENTAFSAHKRSLLDGELGMQYRTKIEGLDAEKAEKFLYQEYVRKYHPERIKHWINPVFNNSVPEACREIALQISDLLNNVDPMFRRDLSLICESHHLSDLLEFDKYKVSRPYGSTTDEIVNLHYAAIILRTADLLHMTSDRTPSSQFALISPSDPVSQLEWRKQMAVKSVRPQIKKNADGVLDHTLEKDAIEVVAYFDAPSKADSFFALIKYLNYAKKELLASFRACNDAEKLHASKFHFPWKGLDDSGIETLGFERKLFEFNLDQTRILKLLVGHTLYNDTTVVLRELVQNAIDAIRLQYYIDVKNNPASEIGDVHINWDSAARKLVFTDTGTGMTQDIIENNLLKIGASRYQDEDFIKKYPDFAPISRFGIGILTCFLIADEIDIITCSNEEENIKKLCVRNVDGKYLLQHIAKTNSPAAIVPHGTDISLHVRADINMDNLEGDLRKWILFPPCNVYLQIDKLNPKQIGFASPKDSIIQYLNDNGTPVDDKTIKVKEETVDGVTVAYAVHYHQHYKEWEFMDNNMLADKTIPPIGTCIEGIRVEFNSPGFRGKRLLAIANCKGINAPKTNVARSLVEVNTHEDIMLQAIYKIFAGHVRQEVDALKTKRGFSLTWATQEAAHLVNPLVRGRDNQNREAIPVRKDLLLEALNQVPFALVEKGKERAAFSAEQIQQEPEIWTIDCNLFRSAESLIKESTSDTSLNKLLDVLYSDSSRITYNDNAILCGFNKNTYLYLHAMVNKQVNLIKIFPNERRVDMLWRNKEVETKWEGFKVNLNRQRNYNRFNNYPDEFVLGENFYIQTRPVHFEGICGEVAVKSFGCTYLIEGSPIHKFLIDCISQLKWRSGEEDEHVLSFIIDMVDMSLNTFSRGKTDNIDEEAIDYIFNRSLSENDKNRRDKERVFLSIDKDLFQKAIFGTDWNVFDTLAWSGRYSSFY